MGQEWNNDDGINQREPRKMLREIVEVEVVLNELILLDLKLFSF